MLVGIVGIGLVTYGIVATCAATRITASVVNAKEIEGRRLVTVEFVRHFGASCFIENNQNIQIRVANQWLSPGGQPILEDVHLLTRTNRQQLVFDFPHEAEAVRISFDYRGGASSAYCKAYGFLVRHGVSQKFPAISKAILSCFSNRRELYHMECELELPAAIPVSAPKLTAANQSFAL